MPNGAAIDRNAPRHASCGALLGGDLPAHTGEHGTVIFIRCEPATLRSEVPVSVHSTGGFVGQLESTRLQEGVQLGWIDPESEGKCLNLTLRYN